MKTYFVKQKFRLGGERFDIKDDQGRVAYLGLRIEGNIWDLDFQLLNSQDQVVARIQKELSHLTSTYTVTVYENTYADLAISLCVAIDYVEMLENSSK